MAAADVAGGGAVGGGAAGLQRAGAVVAKHADWLLGVGVMALLLTLIAPIPPALLDLLLALNISVSLLILLVTMGVRSADELSTFPSVLLFATLFRLGLNVASTRLILTGGAAGNVIAAFGHYVVGDNLAVGLVVFLILVVIQFVVITKGAGRISEVAARFVLDAMPGKQMAIDADLNAGLIDAEQARARRKKVAHEAEFYGAMDGASKFVRGDAIAGLIITALNLVGGIALGSAQGLALAEAVSRYSMLSVGDGLVSQIPALLVSTASAVLVTKASSDESLGTSLAMQLGGRPKAAIIASALVFAIGMLPGMPAVPFSVLACVLLVGWRASRGRERAAAGAGAGAVEAGAAGAAARNGVGSRADGAKAGGDAGGGSESVEELLQVDRVSLEIGYRLIPLVQDKSGTGILDHIAQLRRKFALREGVVIPPVRIKDNIRIDPSAYRVLVGGQEVARGTIEPGSYLAMDGGGVTRPIQGKETVDPAFGLPAWWIREGKREEAELLGYTVIDATSVLVTHLSEVLAGSIAEVLSRDDVKELVEGVRKVAPAVVQELVPEKLGYGEVQKVLRNLLREGVGIRNLPGILEALADHAGKTKDAEALTELVRQRIGRSICERHADKSGVVHAVTLEPGLESRLAAAVGGGAGGGGGGGVGGEAEHGAVGVSPAYLQKVMERVGGAVAAASRGGRDVVVLVRSNVRRFVSELVRASLPKVSVLSYNEVVAAPAVETAGIVRGEE